MSESKSINPTNEPETMTPEERDELEAVPDLLARRFAGDTRTYWEIVWDYFRGNGPAYLALWIMFLFATIAVFSPFIANHRPFIMTIGEGVSLTPLEAQVLDSGMNFPLFRGLRMLDWFLVFSYFEVLLAIWLYRRSKKHEMQVARPIVISMLLIAIIPLLLSLTTSPELRLYWTAEQYDKDWLGKGPFWWAMVSLCFVIGGGLLARSSVRLIWQKRDEFGNLTPLGATVGMVFGTFFLVGAAGFVGTLGSRSLDTTDYFKVAQKENVSAVFPPVAHDYLASNSYMTDQRPLGPRTHVLPSGVSEAASDLMLMKKQRSESLAMTMVDAGITPRDGAEEGSTPVEDNEVSEETRDVGASDGAGETAEFAQAAPTPTLTPDTPLASLNHGEGVRLLDDAIPEFTIVSHSYRSYPIVLHGAATIGDVMDKVESATNGAVELLIGANGQRLEFVDHTPRRPTYWMGTDPSGSDVAARLVRATRVALSIGFVSTSIAVGIGIVVGSLMGYFGGWVDMVGMRVIEIFMAIPRLFLLLTIIAFIPPEFNDYMLYAMMAVIGATTWMGSARFIRAEFFKLRDQDFVQAATACGLPMRSVLFKHMLPNGVTPVLVHASFGVAAAIFVETGLSFLGFGIKPPQPSWGQMLSSAVDVSSGVFHWWMAIFPGIMIFLTVFCFNLIGDALRDAIDPKLQKSD